jgi:hypothetical protein
MEGLISFHKPRKLVALHLRHMDVCNKKIDLRIDFPVMLEEHNRLSLLFEEHSKLDVTTKFANDSNPLSGQPERVRQSRPHGFRLRRYFKPSDPGRAFAGGSVVPNQDTQSYGTADRRGESSSQPDRLGTSRAAILRSCRSFDALPDEYFAC